MMGQIIFKDYPYWAAESENDIKEQLRQITHTRKDDITQIQKLPALFLGGRSVGKIPSSSIDVAATDRIGDQSYAVDGSYLYIFVDASGTPAWRRVSLGSWQMSFLSGLSGILGGGGQQQSSSVSGFAQLPQQIQDAYTNYATQVSGQIPNATAAYTPLGQTPGETQAYSAIDQGFAPNAQQIQSDIAMQQNPYNQSVLNTIQNQAYGQNSALKQNLTAAGAYGSNRGALGANDIANTQANTIGSILGGQYNTELQNALTTLPQLREQSAQAQLGAGANQRQLALSQSSAPIAGLQQIGAALGVLPTNGGTTQQSTESQSGNGTLNNLFGAASGAASSSLGKSVLGFFGL